MGANTTYGWFYKPALGASGQAELDLYNTAMDGADAQIEANKDALSYNDNLHYIYPQDYATGTGTSGDPWAGSCIEDAYTACPAGGTIYMRAGYYALDTVIDTAKSFNLIGEGIQKTFIITSMTTTNAIYIDTDYVTLKGFTIDCDSQTLNEAGGINIHDANYITVEDVEVKNAGKEAITVYQCNNSTFKNLYLHDNNNHGIHPGSDTAGRNLYNIYQNIYCYDNVQYGFYDRGDGEQEHEIEECFNVFDNIQAWGNTLRGISICYQSGANISNCYAYDNGSAGFSLDGLENSNIVNCVATLNGVTNSMAGVLISGSTDLNLTNVIALNNYNGLNSVDCTSIKFNFCQAYDNRETPLQLWGIEIEGTNTGISVLNCKVTPNASGMIRNLAANLVVIDGVAGTTLPVAGDIQYFDGTNWIRLAKGTANQYLKMNGTATAPIWVT